MFLAVALAWLWLTASSARAEDVLLSSPNGHAELRLTTAAGQLEYGVRFRQRPVIETSRAGLVVDGVDLGDGATLGEAATYVVDETYPWLGGKSTVAAKANGVRVSVRHAKSGTTYTVEARAYDDGVAFRYLVPGS